MGSSNAFWLGYNDYWDWYYSNPYYPGTWPWWAYIRGWRLADDDWWNWLGYY